MDYLLENFGAIFWSVIGAAVLGFCKYCHSRMVKYKKMLDEQENSDMQKTIEDALDPFHQHIAELHATLQLMEESNEKTLSTVRDLHKHELIRICIQYLGYGFMTLEEYEWLIEFYAIYKQLGGNGQGDAYYEKVKNLPIKDRHWKITESKKAP